MICDGILEPDDPNFKKEKARLDRQGKYRYRVNRRSWWKEELPSREEYATARTALDSCGWQVNYIFIHCAPGSVMDILGGGMYQPDALSDFHEEVSRRCGFDYWFFGHYHENRVVQRKYISLYERVI